MLLTMVESNKAPLHSWSTLGSELPSVKHNTGSTFSLEKEKPRRVGKNNQTARNPAGTTRKTPPQAKSKPEGHGKGLFLPLQYAAVNQAGGAQYISFSDQRNCGCR